ncbi:MAG: SDR family oxidoreductase [Oscillospiraceae bacterium]|jgi:3-oxoacyl-[acyl-carrier protein] reductase|nr:SDR family oxidoreductase [Oscillospiraceae bacterium]MBQ2145277.1 SDR family oxidoreductase [Oscillospiraceae bacterium]
MDKRVLLVNGASSDIGCELIRNIADNYDCVLAHYNSDSSALVSLREKFGTEKIHLLKADFSDPESVLAMIGDIRSSGLIPSHIVHFPSPRAENIHFKDCSWDKFSAGIDTSFRSAVEILRAFVPDMAKNRYGRVVFMLTAYVTGEPPKFQTPYVTCKYALLGLMKSLASEYSSKGVTFNGVSPEMMNTKFLKGTSHLILEKNAEESPLKRLLLPSDVVPYFTYLLSDEAQNVTGTNITVTGKDIAEAKNNEQ